MHQNWEIHHVQMEGKLSLHNQSWGWRGWRQSYASMYLHMVHSGLGTPVILLHMTQFLSNTKSPLW